MAEKLWFLLGNSSFLAYQHFPEAKSEYLKETTIVLPVQINCKTRGTITVQKGCLKEDAFELASSDEKLCKYFNGGENKKENICTRSYIECHSSTTEGSPIIISFFYFF